MNTSQPSMEEIQGVPNWILNEYQRRQNKPHYHHEDLMISDNMFRGDRQISSTGSYGWNASSSTSTIPPRFHQEERKPSIYFMHNSMYTNSIGVVPDSHLTTSSMYEGIHFPQQANYPTMNFMNNNGEDTRATCMGANFLGFSPSLVKNEGFLSQDVDRIGLDLGARTYFSTEDDVNYDSYCNINSMAMSRLYKRRAMSNVSQVPRCQAEGCKADLSTAKHYHRRHKVCELHSKAATVISAGLTQRFCQQCSRFHVLSEFDEGKRSCRKRLADHNRRRRKPQNNQQNVTLVPDTSTTSGSNANDNSKEQEDNYVINNKQSHSGMKNNQVDISLSESGSLTRMSLSPHHNAKTTNENMESSYDDTLGVGIPWLRATNGENNNNNNIHGLARNCNNVYDFNEVCSTSSSRGYSSFTDLDWTSNAKMMFKTLEEQEMVATLKEWKIRRGSLQ